MLVPLSITALAIGAFEVALSFMGRGQRMSPFEIGLLFAQCTLFMFAAQAMLILPRFRDRSMRPLVIPALVTLAVGLIGMTLCRRYRRARYCDRPGSNWRRAITPYSREGNCGH